MKISKLLLSATVTWAACTWGGNDAAAADIVTNGGFETGDFSGWTSNWAVSGNASGLVPNSGDFFAYTACAGAGCIALNGAFLKQDLATVAGQAYTLSFFVSNDGEPPSEIAAYWQGVQVFDLADLPVNSPGYTQYTVTGLLATSSTTALQFAGRQDPAFLAIDDISVTGPVPEPASLALMLAGLVAVGGIAVSRSATRRRRSRR